MKSIARFLLVALAIVPFGAHSAPVATTRGNNLTAYNGASGSTNNNNWNAMMNVRSGADAADMPVADFGNCNAVLLRCAQPKCANGGCVDMEVTSSIVAGCVRANSSCVQYGNDLVQYISAQLVASSTAKSNAASAAAQSAQQMAQMQQQMQQMQSEMAQQNAETVAQLQSALEEQKQLTAQAIAEAAAARDTLPVVNTVTTTVSDTGSSVIQEQTSTIPGLSAAQQIAAQNGVSADVLAREQITGQIMSSIENAETQLKALKTTMKDVFDYAGCDSKGNNCKGPKRVKVFKQKAMDFFEPYENVLDELYDALIMAQSVGVDITDIYMMMNDSCNTWGKYMCQKDQALRYTKDTCENGRSQRPYSIKAEGYNYIIGGAACTIGKIIPPADGGCQPLGLIPDGETVRYNWLNPEEGDETLIRVGCMSDMLETSKLFRNRKKGSSIDISVLERIIEQDAPSVYGSRWESSNPTTPENTGLPFCMVNENSFAELEKIASLKTLPKEICVTENKMKSLAASGPKAGIDETGNNNTTSKKGDWAKYELMLEDACEEGYFYDFNTKQCQQSRDSIWAGYCSESGGEWDENAQRCKCRGGTKYKKGYLVCKDSE